MAGVVLDQTVGRGSLWPSILHLAAQQLSTGWIVAAISILASVLLPTAFAATLTVFLAAAIAYGVAALKPGTAMLAFVAATVAALVFWVAVAVFERQDLRMNDE